MPDLSAQFAVVEKCHRLCMKASESHPGRVKQSAKMGGLHKHSESYGFNASRKLSGRTLPLPLGEGRGEGALLVLFPGQAPTYPLDLPALHDPPLTATLRHLFRARP